MAQLPLQVQLQGVNTKKKSPSILADSVIIAEGLQRVKPGVKVDPKPIVRDSLSALPADDKKPAAPAPPAAPAEKSAPADKK